MAAAGTLARPYIANAAATTAEVWWVQGFVPEEDVAFKKVVADYEKASGNTIDLSIIPFAPVRQKIVAAMTSGVVPDMFTNNPAEIIALYAWDDKLVDVSDVVETQKEEYTETALLTAYCYNNVEKKAQLLRGAVYDRDVCRTISGGRWSRRPATRWRTSRRPGMPTTISSRRCKRKLREQGVRNVYGLGLNVTTNGNDPNNVFNYFLIAYGGQDIVTKDGKLHLDDPQVREAAIKALTYPTTAYKEGFVPPGAINWNDADDNNAFHAKQIVMDLDGTISTEVAVLSQGKKEDYDDIVTMGLALSNDGKPVPSQADSRLRPDPEGREERRGGQGLPQIFDPAEGHQRVAEDRARPQCSVHAVDRQGRPVVVRPDPHRVAYVDAGPARPDRAGILGLQPGLCPGPERACLAARLGRHHEGRDDAAGGGGEGVQAGRGDLREIPDRVG